MMEATYQQIVASLGRMERYIAESGKGKIVVVSGQTFASYRFLSPLRQDKSVSVLHLESIAPIWLRWLPLPIARFFVLEFYEATNLEKYFSVLSEQGVFSIHVLDPALRDQLIEELISQKDPTSCLALKPDPTRVSWIANMDDVITTSGLAQEWIFGSALPANVTSELVGCNILT